MKKFISIMLWLLIILFFAVFNYLLWDRENRSIELNDLKFAKTSSTETIYNLTSQLSILRDENKRLDTSLTASLSDVEKLYNDIKEMEDTIRQLENDIGKRDDAIAVLVKGADLSQIEESFNGWIQFMINKEVAKAYHMVFGHKMAAEREEIKTFTDFVARIEEIEVVNFSEADNFSEKDSFSEEDTYQGEADIVSSFQGRIVKADISIVLKQNDSAPDFVLKQGTNTYYLYFDYYVSHNMWVITKISPS